MKKIYIFFIIFILSSCEKTSILNTVYISSIGIDYIEEEYIGYFYSPPAKDLGKNSDSDNESTVYVIKDKEFANIFLRIFETDPANINMFHLKTMIISDNFKDIDLLLDYFKFCNKISYNFHVFISDDDLAEVYTYKSMSNISNLYNFLNSPSLIDYAEHGVDKCTFLNFANNYTSKYRYNFIPVVTIEKNSLDEEGFQLRIQGYSNTNFIYKTNDFPAILFLSSNNKYITVNNELVFLSDYQININSKNNLYNIEILYKKTNVSNNLNIKEYIIEEIDYYFETVIINESSIYLIEQYNYLYNKNISTTTYNLLITEK